MLGDALEKALEPLLVLSGAELRHRRAEVPRHGRLCRAQQRLS